MRRHISQGDEEDGHSGREKKRSRVTHACDQCRKRKDRCDGKQPVCRPCAEVNRPCTYNPLKRRGLQPGYVRVVEMLMGLLLQNLDGSQQLVETILRHSLSEAPARLKLGAVTSDSFVQTWRDSSSFRMIEELLTLVDSLDDNEHEDDPIPSLQDRVASALSEAMKTKTASMTDSTPQREAPRMAEQPALRNRVPAANFMQSEARLPFDAEESTTAEPMLPPNWSHLIDNYFSSIHCWFPISQKQDVFRIAHTIANVRDAPPLAHADRALLWAVIALSVIQCSNLSPDADGFVPARSPNELAAEYEKATMKLINISNDHELGHVRALLLLVLIQISRGAHNRAWVLVGQAVYIAGNLGLVPSQYSVPRLSDSQQRVLIGCHVLEALLAARLGRPTYLSWRGMQSIQPLQTDGIEEWEPWKPCTEQWHGRQTTGITYRQIPGQVLSSFSAFAELVGILNELHSLPNQSISGRSVHDVYRKLQSCQARLPRWSPHTGGGLHEPPQLLNIGLISAALSCIINSKAAPLLDDLSKREMLTKHLELVQIFEVYADHLRNRHSKWLSPVLEIYTNLCGLHSSVDTDSCIQPAQYLLGEFAKRWPMARGVDTVLVERRHTGQVNLDPLTMHPINHTWSAVDSSFHSLPGDIAIGVSCPPSAVLDASGIEGASSMTETQQARQLEQILSSSSSHIGMTGAIEVGLAPELPMIEESDHDSLFSSLALLDSVEGMLDTSRFMEHLGIPLERDSIDLESLFRT